MIKKTNGVSAFIAKGMEFKTGVLLQLYNVLVRVYLEYCEQFVLVCEKGYTISRAGPNEIHGLTHGPDNKKLNRLNMLFGRMGDNLIEACIRRHYMLIWRCFH